MTTSITEQFQIAFAAAGLTAPEVIYGDGALRRFSSNGKGADQSGWYVLHDEGDMAAGAFGCWRAGVSRTWCSKDVATFSPTQRATHQRRMRAIAQQREADKAQRQNDAAMAAAIRWEAASTAPTDHPYLIRKSIQAHGIKAEGEALLIPLRDTTTKLHSLQAVGPEGDKRFQPGGRVKGCYFAMGKPNGLLIVCEGFATGASIHEATGHAVACAMNAGNLLEVAQALRVKYPQLRLILAADDDAFSDGNPGLSKACEAAQAVGGDLAKPDFGHNRHGDATDFNDLHRLLGLDAVKACFDQVVDDANDSSWPAPVPLPSDLPAVAPFAPELLPEALRSWVVDIADRMQCPPDFTAVGVVVALSSLIGARVVVRPKARDDWAVVPNLWGAIVGRPGVMKSPALSEVLKPLQQLEKSEREQWQAEREAWQLDCKVAELAAKANEKQAAAQAAKDPAKARALLERADSLTVEPTMRRYVVNDATVEKLADLLTVNPWGTLVYRDEIHGLLCSMDKPGQEGARGFYLTGYDGNQGHAVDRIGRGESFVPRVCLAMLGGIQPGKIQNYVREAVAGGAGDDGLLQRFGLMVWPDVNREFVYVDRSPDIPAKQAACAVFERLNQLQPADDSVAQVWRFSPAAQALFEEWLIPFETELRGEELHPALVSHLAKYRKLIPALALIFALVDTPDSANLIHEHELLRALAWADYLRTHAERLYAAAVMPETGAAQQLLDKIKAGKLANSDGTSLDAFTPRQVAVKHWTGLGAPEAVRKAANLLADYGWLEREVTLSGAAGGRPSERYLIHPSLVKKGAP
jgi:putative DNA primase/helicase